MLRAVTDGKCGLCPQYDEIIDIISACTILAKEQYIKRHDSVCAQLALNICNEMGIKLGNEHWYENAPKLIERSHEGS